ncbi:hypothetical protein VTP01DRAFT_9302 [Rhizomucor pusillus]|uniref:uncharacterized protein n=1 Tax=Rhizomucor pusillus TaxID=4840 RepID=UPI0037422A99
MGPGIEKHEKPRAGAPRGGSRRQNWCPSGKMHHGRELDKVPRLSLLACGSPTSDIDILCKDKTKATQCENDNQIHQATLTTLSDRAPQVVLLSGANNAAAEVSLAGEVSSRSAVSSTSNQW